jgi:hypothetical protein
MKNQQETCVQCGKPIVGAGQLTDEQREAVAEAARMANGKV